MLQVTIDIELVNVLTPITIQPKVMILNYVVFAPPITINPGAIIGQHYITMATFTKYDIRAGDIINVDLQYNGIVGQTAVVNPNGNNSIFFQI